MSLDAIGIVSKDLDMSKEFYKLLGIELKPVGSNDHLEGETSSGVRIMVDSVELMQKIYQNWIAPHGAGVVLCFKQSSIAAVDSTYKSILSADFESIKEPWDAFWGQRYASVKDPDGNQVDIFAPLKL